MKKFVLSLLALFLLSLLNLSFAKAEESDESLPPPPTPMALEYYNAIVTKITAPEIGENAELGQQAPGDIEVSLQIKGGERNGDNINTWWDNNQNTSRSFQVQEGSKLIIACGAIEGEETCNIVDQQRMTGLIVMLALFIAVIWWITRKHGLLSFLAMALGLAIIMLVIIPLIIKGASPLIVTILAGSAIIIPTIYISHGFKAKSHLALVSILLATLIIALLALLFSNLLKLYGSTGEEILYLNPDINLKAVLLSAILLGAFGVIDDIAVTQVSIVNELYQSNPKFSSIALFKRAMQVGRDHIASLVNTLFLAYAGVSLPLLILFKQNNIPAFVAIQQEPIATEIMRTLIGTIGLILVVPLTTYIASEIIVRNPKLFPKEDHHHIH